MFSLEHVRAYKAERIGGTFILIIMVEAYLHSIDVALAEAYAEHLAPILHEISHKLLISRILEVEERVRFFLGDAVEQVDTAKVMATFRANNTFPHLPRYLKDFGWPRNTQKNGTMSDWEDLVVARILCRPELADWPDAQ